MNDLISIIVPVYNAQNTLDRCIGSILAQTYTDFQLILINDCSTDTSGTICDSYAGIDHRVIVHHKPANEGASAARNSGLDIARGKYIAFCDSDDVVSPTWLTHLEQFADELVHPMCSYCYEEEQLGKKHQRSIPSGHLVEVAGYYQFNKCGLAGYLWNALYRNDIIQKHHIRFRVQRESGDYNEDLLFALEYIRHMKYLVYVGFSDYWYDTHEGSLSRSKYNLYFDKYEEKYMLWRTFIEEYGNAEEINDLASNMLYHFLFALKNAEFKLFHRVVFSEAVQHCITKADISSENPTLIRYISNKSTVKLWLRYRINALKG